MNVSNKHEQGHARKLAPLCSALGNRMRQLTSAACLFFLFFSTAISAGEWRHFSLRSAPGFVVMGEIDGRVKLSEDRANFEIEKGSLVLNPQLEAGESDGPGTPVSGIQFGLARFVEGEVWDVYGYSQKIELDVVISPDSREVELAPLKISMRLPRNFDRKKEFWVILQIEMLRERPGDFGYAYAHEQQIFEYDRE